jgi:hypothetical protein
VGQLGDAQGRAHPSLRHLLLRRRAPRGPTRRRREHRNRSGRLGDPAVRSRRLRGGPVLPAAADVDAVGLAQRPRYNAARNQRGPDGYGKLSAGRSGATGESAE